MNPSFLLACMQPGTSALEYLLFPLFMPLLRPQKKGYCKDCIGSSIALPTLQISRSFFQILSFQ